MPVEVEKPRHIDSWD